jgi:hypothetical protein
LWTETRTADKSGVFGLFGIKYQVGPGNGRRRLQIRYDPDALHEVEVWRNGNFVQRARPLFVTAHRRPKQIEETKEEKPETPVADYLGHLVAKRRAEGIVEPPPKALAEKAKAKREQNTLDILALLDDRLDQGVVSSADVRTFMDAYGPLDMDLAEIALDEMLVSGAPKDLTVSIYLAAMRDAQQEGGIR